MTDDVRVPAGWYPDPLGLPQLRWWDNHKWTEHVSDARPPARSAGPQLAYLDDEPEPMTGRTDVLADLPSRRELRERERLAHAADPGAAAELAPPATQADGSGGASGGGPGAATGYADTGQRSLESLGAPPADAIPELNEPSPAVKYAMAGYLDDAPTGLRYELDERYDDLLGAAGAAAAGGAAGGDSLGAPSTPRSSFAHASSGAGSYVPGTQEELDDDARFAGGRIPARTALRTAISTSTGPGWLLTAIPVYMLVAGMLILLSGSTAMWAVNLALLFGVPWIAGIVLAVLDHRMLDRQGMERPAHWAWAFGGPPVYLVARLVATVRETGTGFGPVLTYIVLTLFGFGAIVAIPGLVMLAAPGFWSQAAEASVATDAAALGADITVDCPETVPMLVNQSFTCIATNDDGRVFNVVVSLQRANGWIDWRVDDWGIFELG